MLLARTFGLQTTIIHHSVLVLSNMSAPNCLLDHLLLPHPKLTHSFDCKGGPNTRGEFDDIKSIEDLEAFDFPALQAMYGPGLRQRLTISQCERTTLPHVPSYPFCKISDKDSIERVFSVTSQWTVDTALEIGVELLENADISGSRSICMARRDRTLYTKDHRLDWAGRAIGLNRNMLPGVTKVARKWFSSQI